SGAPPEHREGRARGPGPRQELPSIPDRSPHKKSARRPSPSGDGGIAASGRPGGIGQKLNVRRFGVLAQPPAISDPMKADAASRRTADVGDAVLAMSDDRAPLEPETACPTVRRPDTSLARLASMQLPTVQLQRCRS